MHKPITPDDILKFMSKNLHGLRMLFEAGRTQSYVLDSSVFEKIRSENSLDLEELMRFRFIKQQTVGNYKLRKEYVDFLEFIFEAAALNLPDKFKHYAASIREYFNQLQLEEEEQKIKLLINSLQDQIDEFLTEIDSQTKELIRNTEALKMSGENESGLYERIRMASHWRDTFIAPLNQILNPDSPDAIVTQLHLINSYAHRKHLFERDPELATLFGHLYGEALRADEELTQLGNRIVRELMPLLDRIRTSSKILAGFYHYLEVIGQNRHPEIPPPDLVSRKNFRAYSTDWQTKAELLLDTFFLETDSFVEEELSQHDYWTPDTAYFKTRLLESLPVDDFYRWCFDVLKNETPDINLNKFFSVSKLILDAQFEADFEMGTDKFELELEDATLTLPKVKLYASPIPF